MGREKWITRKYRRHERNRTWNGSGTGRMFEKIRSENRDLKMEMNILKEEAKKNNQLLLSQKSSLSVIMEMLEKLTSTHNENSPKSSRKRLYSDLSLPIDLTEGKSKEKGMFFSIRLNLAFYIYFLVILFS
jgi:hypothetical protein